MIEKNRAIIIEDLTHEYSFFQGIFFLRIN